MYISTAVKRGEFVKYRAHRINVKITYTVSGSGQNRAINNTERIKLYQSVYQTKPQ